MWSAVPSAASAGRPIAASRAFRSSVLAGHGAGPVRMPGRVAGSTDGAPETSTGPVLGERDRVRSRTPPATPNTARTITTRVVSPRRRRLRSIFRWRAWRSCLAWSLRSAFVAGPSVDRPDTAAFGRGAVRVDRFRFAIDGAHPTTRDRELSCPDGC